MMTSQWLLHLVCFAVLLHISFEATSSQSGSGKRSIAWFKPIKKKLGFFGLISQFVQETIQDTNFVVRNLTDIINSEFPSTAQPAENGTNSTNTTETKLTLSQVNDVLGRNYRSLVRLFNSEFRVALTDSRNNIVQYKNELQGAVRPYFHNGAWSTTTTPRTTPST